MENTVKVPGASLDTPPICGSMIKNLTPESAKGGYLNPQIFTSQIPGISVGECKMLNTKVQKVGLPARLVRRRAFHGGQRTEADD